MQNVTSKSSWKVQRYQALFTCALLVFFMGLCLCSCSSTQNDSSQQAAEETSTQESNDQETAPSSDGETIESDEKLNESSNEESGSSDDGQDSATALDAASSNPNASESDDLEIITVEDLPAIEDAEEETGILDADATTSYAEGEILVRLPKKISVDEVNAELERLEFIEESKLTQDMLVSGEIQDDTVVYGAIGESVVKIHTASDVSVPQAIMALQDSTVLLNPQPNYLMTASV